jgi:hypothetical protein
LVTEIARFQGRTGEHGGKRCIHSTAGGLCGQACANVAIHWGGNSAFFFTPHAERRPRGAKLSDTWPIQEHLVTYKRFRKRAASGVRPDIDSESNAQLCDARCTLQAANTNTLTRCQEGTVATVTINRSHRTVIYKDLLGLFVH